MTARARTHTCYIFENITHESYRAQPSIMFVRNDWVSIWLCLVISSGCQSDDTGAELNWLDLEYGSGNSHGQRTKRMQRTLTPNTSRNYILTSISTHEFCVRLKEMFLEPKMLCILQIIHYIWYRDGNKIQVKIYNFILYFDLPCNLVVILYCVILNSHLQVKRFSPVM